MDSTYISNEILKTKYKDVSFDQVSGCFVPADEEDCFNWEYMFRGKEVTIFLPPIPNNLIENGFIYENSGKILIIGPTPPCPSGCNGPFYGILGYEGTVCKHLIEINDNAQMV
jgi:hypothetical protein